MSEKATTFKAIARGIVTTSNGRMTRITTLVRRAGVFMSHSDIAEAGGVTPGSEAASLISQLVEGKRIDNDARKIVASSLSHLMDSVDWADPDRLETQVDGDVAVGWLYLSEEAAQARAKAEADKKAKAEEAQELVDSLSDDLKDEVAVASTSEGMQIRRTSGAVVMTLEAFSSLLE